MIKSTLWGVILAVVSIIGLSVWAKVSQDAVVMSSPHVKVTYAESKGHGSATHIGGGYFLTAAHVIKDDATPLLDGVNSEVLWVNEKYDVALLHANVYNTAKANLECREPEVSERVSMYGNPINLEGVTTWGQVSGVSREVGPWASVIPVNAAIAPGMSGGALMDEGGDLVGVNVGVMVMAVGFSGGPVGIGYSVPSSVICMLMGVDR